MSSIFTGRTERISDLEIAFIFLIISGIAISAHNTPRLLVLLLGIPFLLILPGYALIAALFPRIPFGTTNIADNPSGPGWVARSALSLLTSAVILAVLGFILSQREVLHLHQIIVAVAAVSAIGLSIAYIRRRRVPIEHRADPVAIYLHKGGHSQRSFNLQTSLFVLAVLALLGSIAFTGVIAGPSQSYTEAYLVPQGPGADSVTEIGTSTLETGDETSVALAIENSEGIVMNYSVILKMEQVGPAGTITNESSIDNYHVSVEHGETITTASTVVAPNSAGAVRLQYLIYKGDVPEEPTIENADLSLRYWLTIVEERPE